MFDFDWDSYYESGTEAWETKHPSTELQRVIAEEKLQPCRTIELGRGTGLNAVWLAQQGFEVTAVDISPRAAPAGIKIRFVVDVAFIDETAYVLVTGVAADLGGHDIVGIYRVDGPHSFTVVADIGAWSIAHPPATDFFVPTGFQYAIQSYRDGFLVTDGHHNRVLWVTLDGEITQVIAFDDIVPTGLAVKQDKIYMAEAGPIPHLPETSKVMSFTLKSSAATQVASGAGLSDIGLLVDVEFGHGNTLYALLQGFWNGPFEGTPAQPNTGALAKVNGDGTFTIIVEGLNQPTSVEIIKNTAYVVTQAGEVWKIENVSPPPYGN